MMNYVTAPSALTSVANASSSQPNQSASNPIYAIAKIILFEESGSLNSHQVGINFALAKQIFKIENESEFENFPHYVRLTNRIYRAILFPVGGADQASIVMSPFQQHDIVISGSSAVVAAFNPQKGPVGSLDSLEIHLFYHPNEEAQREHLLIKPYPLSKTKMTSQMKMICSDLILHSQQKLLGILEDQNSVSAVVKFGRSHFLASVRDTSKEFGQITQSTFIKFIYNNTEVSMIGSQPNRAISVVFKITVDKISHKESGLKLHAFPGDRSHASVENETLVLDQEELIAHFKKLLGDQLISLGQTFIFQYKGHKISLCPERINRNYLNIHSLDGAEITGYQLDQTEIEFRINSPNVLLGKNQPIIAEKSHVQILKRIATASMLDKDGPAWISLDDLWKELAGKIVLNGQVLRISLADGEYSVTFSFTPSKDQSISPYQFYLLDNYTSDSTNELKAIQSSVRFPISYIMVTIKPKTKTAPSGLFHNPEDSEETDGYEIDKQDLVNAIGKITYPIYEKACITVTVKGKQIPLEVTLMEAESNDKSRPQVWLGKIVNTTSMSVNNDALATGIVLSSKDDPVADRADLLKQLKNSLGGLDHVFEQICNIITQSRGGMVEEARKRGVQPIRGLLLYGPPGTGKTSTARLIGQLLNCKRRNINRISGTDVLNKWVGGTEDRIRKLFEPAENDWRRLGEKSDLHLLMIDELDGLLPDRNNDRLSPHAKGFVNAFLAKMDGFEQMHNLFVIGLTNRLYDIDPAARRYGRFSRKIEVGLPTFAGRKEIFRIYTKVIECNRLLGCPIDYDKLAQVMAEANGAEIRGVVEYAASFSLARLEKLNLTKEHMLTHPDRMVIMQDLIAAANQYVEKNKSLLSKIFTSK